ncbi:MAG: hypothetical protein IBX62_06665 [Coriobacteriia bacterium]|nr:hypothetical protein [Coriobacteriia bacterium]
MAGSGRSTAAAMLASALVLSALAGCAQRVRPPEETPSITGRVEDVAEPFEDGCVLTLKVEGPPVEGEALGCAVVSVPEDAVILTGGRRAADVRGPDAIRLGDEVMVWHAGDVALNCPARIRAGAVLVLDGG